MTHAILRRLSAPFRSRWERSELVQRIVANTSWLVAERAARLLIGLLVGAWIARYLGPAAFGQLNFAVAYVTILGSIAGLGLEGILVRNLVAEPDRSNTILGTSFGLRLAAGAISYVAILATIGTIRPDETRVMMALVAVIGVSNLLAGFDVIDYWFQSRVQSKYVVYARTAAFLSTTPVRIWLILTSASLVGFAWAILAEAGIAAIGLVIVYQTRGGRLSHWRWRLRTAIELLKDSWPLIFSNILIILYMRIDQIMLGRMVGDTELGIYSVAVRLSEVWYVIPTAVVASAYPSIVEAKHRSEALLYERLQRLYNGVSLLSYAIAIPVSLTAPWVIGLLFGPAYARAAPVLVVLIWSIHFTSLGMARSSLLMSMNWTRLHFWTVLAGAGANVLLNVALIPRYGALGSAVATLVSYWLAAHGTCFLSPRLWKTARMLTRALVMPRL